MPTSVVTGATGGIGRWIALGLIAAGHEVVVVGRNADRGNATTAWLRERVPRARVNLQIADLALLGETRRLGDLLIRRYPTIDLLINNAGMFLTRREVTAEGREMVLALNHLSPFILTGQLLPALRRARTARIVNVGSSTSDRARLALDDLEGVRRWGMVHAYSQSKLALTMMTMAWAKRLEGTGVVANVVHPGTVATGLVKAPGAIGCAWRLMAPFVLTEAEGAAVPLHVALSSEFGSISGAYVKRCKVVRPHRHARDPAMIETLWQATEKLVTTSVA
jgi:NAD(P)-dependent dehydrogenase (short-subunit alcohol dehydrogenase family)